MATTRLYDVEAMERELARISEHGYQWGQGPGTDYFREVEVELIEARRAAGLPMLNVTYGGIGYRLRDISPATGFNLVAATTWRPEQLGGAFGIVQRLGDGRTVKAAVLDNGEGQRWLVLDLAAIEEVDR